jgi:pimeloyl-ACP methyl ester carboxylesterase
MSQPVPGTPVPFTIQVSDAETARLKSQLSDTYLPASPPVPDASWDYGVDLDWLKEMKSAWLSFDFQHFKGDINKYPQFKVLIEEVELHYVHVKSSRKNAIPIVLLHGWPGSFYEYWKVVKPLSEPDPNDAEAPAFDVIIVSLPGFAYSSSAPKRGWTVKDSARIIDTLMTSVLSYPSYLAQGGDWGSLVANRLSAYPACKLVHLTFAVVQPPYPLFYAFLWLLPSLWGLRSWISSFFLGEEDKRQLTRTKDFAMSAGYFLCQSTQPMQIGYALMDNPLGLLIWVGSKYKELVDPSLENGFPTRELLTTLSIYYLSKSFHTSTLPYFENSLKEPYPPITGAKLGISIFRWDVGIVPKSWAERFHGKNLVFHKVHTAGGHFPAIDNPEGLVRDLREFTGKNRGEITIVGDEK